MISKSLLITLIINVLIGAFFLYIQLGSFKLWKKVISSNGDISLIWFSANTFLLILIFGFIVTSISLYIKSYSGEPDRVVEQAKKPEALTILFDETRHCFKESNNQCEVYRIGVRNQGRTTVKNVAVKITSITASQEKQNDELRKFVGLKLCLSVNPFGEYSHPDNLPESSVILHPGDEATFDLMRLCIIPANYRVFHSNFFLNPQTSRLDQRPRGVLSPGKYTVAISVQGDDLNPIEQRFEVSSSSKSVTFRPVEDVF